MQRVVVVRFPNGEWSYGGKLSDPEYAQCDRWLIPVSEGKGCDYALKLMRSLTPAQREIMKSFVDEECTTGELGIYFNAARTIKSLERKGLIKIDSKQGDYFYIELA